MQKPDGAAPNLVEIMPDKGLPDPAPEGEGAEAGKADGFLGHLAPDGGNLVLLK
ncbi:hypothetical protein D3C76_1831670 [compost metagenome]